MKIDQYSNKYFDQLVKLYRNKKAYGGNYDEMRDEPSRLEKTAQQRNLYIVVDDLDNLVGSVMILDNPHTFWLLRFVISPDIDGSEVANILLKKVDSIAKARGHDSIIVYTDSKDADLNSRYRNLGFSQGGDYSCYWRKVV